MSIDMEALRSGRVSIADLTRDIKQTDLRRMTDELFDALEAILTDVKDAAVLFVPRDPAASDQNEEGWTISHVVAHLTATLEGAAAAAAMLARGAKIEGNLRYEVHWESLSTIQLVQARLRESHRMCCAFLDAWPDEPHLDETMTLIPVLGPLNAIGFSALGVMHGQGHLDQLRETIRQSTLA